ILRRSRRARRQAHRDRARSVRRRPCRAQSAPGEDGGRDARQHRHRGLRGRAQRRLALLPGTVTKRVVAWGRLSVELRLHRSALPPEGPTRRSKLDEVTTGDYLVRVKAVGIKDLKARLSEYVRLVKAGETILVTERDEVVAELRPAHRQARPA